MNIFSKQNTTKIPYLTMIKTNCRLEVTSTMETNFLSNQSEETQLMTLITKSPSFFMKPTFSMTLSISGQVSNSKWSLRCFRKIINTYIQVSIDLNILSRRNQVPFLLYRGSCLNVCSLTI